jgi:hypothetical protein
MIGTRSAVQHEQHGPIDHVVTIGHQPHTVHIEVDRGVTDPGSHGRRLACLISTDAVSAGRVG